MIGSSGRKVFLSWLAFLSSPAPMVTAFASLNTPSSSSALDDIAVVGCGVLGTSLCKQLLESSDFNGRTITAITKTNNRHESILDIVGRENSENGRFKLATLEDISSSQGEQKSKFKDVVFCAPPSGFDDYAGAVEDAVTNIWAGSSLGGAFVFTSSGGIYGDSQDGAIVNESSPVCDPKTNPRSGKLVYAEEVCRKYGGCCLRLAGLYTLDRGAHSYWFACGKDELPGRPDGIINLLHYDDAASSCIAALKAGYPVVGGKVFLVSDSNPTTRLGICESAVKAKKYADRVIPKFIGNTDTDPLGKVYDGSMTDETLRWKPKYDSFDKFMSSNA